eukprot:TRINITY_DN9139_c0_g1_i1.p1 TRINITY_DN9139_c0_g1~~TRINITY_DN9139_c0_g1_i1.p1  ORF type:complete len:483 (+),score=131.99 TRINITY_DN9139_c0_g1_i1:103-1551(+)
MSCKCGSKNITHNPSGGLDVCLNCGRVLEEGTIVTDVQFKDRSVVGKFGSKSGSYTTNKTLARYNHDGGRSRLERAQRMISEIGDKLSLPGYLIEMAKNVYELAASETFRTKFVKGRPTKHVVAASLYLACRLNKQPLMLIDFSDVLHVNLYELGACYTKLVKFLHQDHQEYHKIPLQDPSMFIPRFCEKLEFGDKKEKVSRTALRFVQRFDRDWMCDGRRPTSLCGAAILMSARFHGFTRTTTQIADKLHVCEETIRKRLDEFKETKVAKLTREEFEKLDLDKDIVGAADPPAFSRASKRAKDRAGLLEDTEKKPLQALTEKGEEALGQVIEEVEEEEKEEVVEKPVRQKEEKAKGNDDDGERLSDVSDPDIDHFLLTPEESSLKKILWDQINRDWVLEQEKKQATEPIQRTVATVKKKRRGFEVVDAKDPLTALSQNSRLSGKVNVEVAAKLFGEPMKKVKEVDEEPIFEAYEALDEDYE